MAPATKTSTFQLFIVFLIVISILGMIVFSTMAQEKMFVANPALYTANSIANANANAYANGYGYGYQRPQIVFR